MHKSPYDKIDRVFLHGNDSMIVSAVSEMAIWRLEGDGYIREKSCQLEDVPYMFIAIPNSNTVCYIGDSATLILYDLNTCKRVFEKTFYYLTASSIKDVHPKTNGVLVNFASQIGEVFNWNGSFLEPVWSIYSLLPVTMSKSGVLLYRHDMYRQELSVLNITTSLITKIPIGFEFFDAVPSADGVYAVIPDQKEENVAVYNLVTERRVFYGSNRVCRLTIASKTLV